MKKVLKFVFSLLFTTILEKRNPILAELYKGLDAKHDEIFHFEAEIFERGIKVTILWV